MPLSHRLRSIWTYARCHLVWAYMPVQITACPCWQGVPSPPQYPLCVWCNRSKLWALRAYKCRRPAVPPCRSLPILLCKVLQTTPRGRSEYPRYQLTGTAMNGSRVRLCYLRKIVHTITWCWPTTADYVHLGYTVRGNALSQIPIKRYTCLDINLHLCGTSWDVLRSDCRRIGKRVAESTLHRSVADRTQATATCRARTLGAATTTPS